MGLFSFIRDAGEKLLGIADDDVTAPEVSITSPPPARETPALSASTLHLRIKKLGLAPDDLSVGFVDGRVTLKGTVADAAQRERIILAVGNVNGVAVVDDQMTVPAEEPESTFYTVVRGDTLSKIAKEHYGNAMKYPVIFEANRPMLKDPDRIYPGQVLRIPPLG